MKVLDINAKPVKDVCSSFEYKGFTISSSNVMTSLKGKPTLFEVCVFKGDSAKSYYNGHSVESAIEYVDSYHRKQTALDSFD